MVTFTVLSDADVPAHIECPKCGAKNMRTESYCSKCDASLIETKECLLAERAKSRGKDYQSDPFAGERREAATEVETPKKPVFETGR